MAWGRAWRDADGDGASNLSHGRRLGGGPDACTWTGRARGAPEGESLEGDEAGQRRGKGRGSGRPDAVFAVCITYKTNILSSRISSKPNTKPF